MVLRIYNNTFNSELIEIYIFIIIIKKINHKIYFNYFEIIGYLYYLYY